MVYLCRDSAEEFCSEVVPAVCEAPTLVLNASVVVVVVAVVVTVNVILPFNAKIGETCSFYLVVAYLHIYQVEERTIFLFLICSWSRSR